MAAGDAQIIDLYISTALPVSNDNLISTSWLTFSAINLLYDSSYGYLLPEIYGIDDRLWWCEGTYKIYQHRQLPQSTASKVDISAAGNEYQPFQLVVHAGTGDISVKSITASSLSGDYNSLLASEVSILQASTRFSKSQLFQVLYVYTSEATDELGIAEEYWPDPLVPVEFPVTCEANTNCPFWVLIHVPEGTKPGV